MLGWEKGKLMGKRDRGEGPLPSLCLRLALCCIACIKSRDGPTAHTLASLPTLALALSLTLVLVQVLMPVLTLMPARK